MPSLAKGEYEAAMAVYRDERLIRLAPLVRPLYEWMPDLERDPEKVPKELSDAFRACRTAKAPWPLMVHGSVGSGKSRFAMLCHDWYGGAFFDFAALVGEYGSLRRGTLTADGSNMILEGGDWTVREAYWVEALKRPRIFILDDIGRRSDSDAATARELLSRLLDARENQPSLLISNLNPQQIERLYDDRIASRMCAGTVVKVEGQDRRIG